VTVRRFASALARDCERVLDGHGSIMARTIVREAIVERRQTQIRWSAVFAGTVTAVGAWILLELLGAGIGLSVIDTERGSNLRGVGIGTGIWSVFAPLIALFLGALVGARLSGTRDRRIGALHGVVMWGLTSALGVLAIIATISAIASGVARVGSAAVSAAGSAVKAVGPEAAKAGGQALGLEPNDLVAPMNERLRQQGKPEITADQLSATMRGVAQRGLREGKLDREVFVDELSRNTQMSRPDAEDLANQFSDRVQQSMSAGQQKVDQLQQQAKQVAFDAARASGRAMLWAGIGELVALIAAMLGGALGVARSREPVVAESEVVSPT
jgi:hypothetical protein